MVMNLCAGRLHLLPFSLQNERSQFLTSKYSSGHGFLQENSDHFNVPVHINSSNITEGEFNSLDLSFVYLQTQLILNNHDQYIYS